MTADDLYRLLNSGGVVALLVIMLYGGWKAAPWWVFGREFRAMVEERDRWREIATRGITTAEKAVTTIEADHHQR